MSYKRMSSVVLLCVVKMHPTHISTWLSSPGRLYNFFIIIKPLRAPRITHPCHCRDCTPAIHPFVTAQRRDLLGSSVQAMQPLARSLLLDSWRGLLHQLQLTASQHTMVSNLARNTLTRLRTLQLRRAHLAQDLHAACLTALATSHGDKTHVSVVRTHKVQ